MSFIFTRPCPPGPWYQVNSSKNWKRTHKRGKDFILQSDRCILYGLSLIYVCPRSHPQQSIRGVTSQYSHKKQQSLVFCLPSTSSRPIGERETPLVADKWGTGTPPNKLSHDSSWKVILFCNFFHFPSEYTRLFIMEATAPFPTYYTFL